MFSISSLALIIIIPYIISMFECLKNEFYDNYYFVELIVFQSFNFLIITIKIYKRVS